MPIDFSHSPVTRLAEQTNRLEPTEDLFDPFAEFLADGVTAVPGDTAIDR